MVFSMSTLAEIEQAAEVLPVEQKQRLVAFLLAGLRKEGTPLPRDVKHTLAVSILLILTVSDTLIEGRACDCVECRRQEASLN